jgi:hypothetical protein
MKMQTVNKETGKPQDFSVFHHGTIGEIVPHKNEVTGKEDPFSRYENGRTIFVESLRKAGADFVPVDGQ